jgi:hypothetical protein
MLVSIMAHPLPGWYSDAMPGIFVKSDLYSAPAFTLRGEMFA